MDLRDYRMLIYAVVLIAMMLFNWAPAASNWRQTHVMEEIIGAKNNKGGSYNDGNVRSKSSWLFPFGGLRAVDGFEMYRSKKVSLYGLIGPNGAGKTTVFQYAYRCIQTGQMEALYWMDKILPEKKPLISIKQELQEPSRISAFLKTSAGA